MTGAASGVSETTSSGVERVHNFSAGPAALPLEVLEEARRDLVDIDGSGIGVLEHSHRGGVFDRVMAETQDLCREIAGIPDDYHVLFMQGGATLQFLTVPMNLLRPGGTADYLNTGVWSKKAIKEAEAFGRVNVVCSSEESNFDHIPPRDAWGFSSDAAYCHFTSNNTIFGTEFHAEPEHPAGAPLVCDMSSDVFSRPLDVSKYGLIYAGAQKNLGPAGCALVIARKGLVDRAREDAPAILRYKTYADQDSRPNTPNTFAIYLMGRVFSWIKSRGGLAAIGEANARKARSLYRVLDGSPFYKPTVSDPGSRSNMNVCFRCADETLEGRFIAEAEAAGLRNLKGHRSVGGMRASIYNAVSEESVEALIGFMREFERVNG